jgi:spermidine/putrescine transport system substrate-binding protein
MNKKRSVARVIIDRFLIVALCASLYALVFYGPQFILSFFPDNSLHVFTYTELISPESFQEFTERTGIPVRVSHYQYYEDMLAKFYLNRGKGYDLIVTGDYMVEQLIKSGFVQPIDHSKISKIAELDRRMLNAYYDPQNKYSLPYAWAVHGIGYDKEFFGRKLTGYGWELLFKPPHEQEGNLPKYDVCMPDSTRDATAIGSKYLFGAARGLTQERLDLMLPLMRRQHNFVRVYNSDKPDYFLLSGIVQVSAIMSSYVRKLRLINPEKFEFLLPSQGAILSVENLLIPVLSDKHEDVYKLMNFLLSKESIAYNSNRYGFNPMNLHAVALVDKDIVGNPNMYPHGELFEKLDILENDVPYQKLENFWVSVKMGS